MTTFSPRFDYDGVTGKLIVQIPSAIHEAGVSAIYREFDRASMLMERNSSIIDRNWDFHTGAHTLYGGNERQGSFIGDMTVHVHRQSVFILEVAFSQTWEQVRAKALRILKNPAIIGVLVMKINERPSWSSPRSRSGEQDYFIEDDFNIIDLSRAFQLNGNVWMGRVKIDVALFQAGHDGDPRRVSFPCLIIIMINTNLTTVPIAPKG
jgi:hypothetical protein